MQDSLEILMTPFGRFFAVKLARKQKTIGSCYRPAVDEPKLPMMPIRLRL